MAKVQNFIQAYNTAFTEYLHYRYLPHILQPFHPCKTAIDGADISLHQTFCMMSSGARGSYAPSLQSKIIVPDSRHSVVCHIPFGTI